MKYVKRTATVLLALGLLTTVVWVQDAADSYTENDPIPQTYGLDEIVVTASVGGCAEAAKVGIEIYYKTLN